MAIVNINNDTDFVNVLSNFNNVVVLFTAHWCLSCKYLYPKINDVVDRYIGLKIVSVDIDKFKQISDICKIDSIPSILLFKKGKLIHKIISSDYDHIIYTIDDVYLHNYE